MDVRANITAFLDSERVKSFILWIILINAALLGLETSDWISARVGGLINILDKLCLAIFVAELIAKLIAYRFRFFRSGWNIFDFIIVGISLVPGADGLSVLRALRIFRVLRVISSVPSLRRVVEGLLNALPGMGSVFVLTAMIFYIGSVMTTKLFGDAFPDWFGDLGLSAYSLFQIMTLESWSMGIVRPVMDQYPYAWVFFVPFILATSFAVVNLLVGLIVNSMQDAAEADDKDTTDAYRDEVLKRLEAIEQRLAEKPGE